MGEWEAGTARLEEAVQAFHEALKEFTRERTPHQWNVAQNNLKVALELLNQRNGRSDTRSAK